MNKEELLKQVMTYCFAQNEWNLYLDTHPHDKFALKTHAEVAKKAKELKQKYENEYGPFTAQSNETDNRWAWIEDPWPWD
jgi:spore coat protein JB